MSKADDIRAWAAANGIAVPERGPLAGNIRRRYDKHLAAVAAPDPGDDDPWAEGPGEPGDDGFTAADEPPEDRAAAAAAAAARAASADPPAGPPAGRGRAKGSGRPRPPAGPGWRDRLRRPGPAAGKPQGRPRPPKPARPARPRVPLDSLISKGYSALAKAAGQFNVPLSRVMSMQAPLAGSVLDEAWQETIIDKLLQPVARAEAKGEATVAIIGPPLCVVALQAQPGMAAVILPLLRQSLAMWIRISGPMAVQAAKQEAAWEAEYGPEIDAMISLMFAGIPGFDPAAGPFEGTPDRAQWEAARDAERAAGNGAAQTQTATGMVLQTYTPPGP